MQQSKTSRWQVEGRWQVGDRWQVMDRWQSVLRCNGMEKNTAAATHLEQRGLQNVMSERLRVADEAFPYLRRLNALQHVSLEVVLWMETGEGEERSKQRVSKRDCSHLL